MAACCNYHKRAIFGTDQPISSDSALIGSDRARTGAHNDCLGAAVDDWGTYTRSDIEKNKVFLSADNKFVPQGGETCNPSGYSGCTNMLTDLKRMRWDLLNIDILGRRIDGTPAMKRFGQKANQLVVVGGDQERARTYIAVGY